MKKYLLLILGVFLIGFISATITITVIDQPVLNVTLMSGGDLTANTTYYFVGLFHNSPTGSSNPNSYSVSSFGAASTEVNITTNDTHRQINMTWAVPSTIKTNLIVKWNTATLMNPDGSYIVTSGNKWNALYSQTGWVGTLGTKTINSADLLNIGTAYYRTNAQIACAMELPAGIDYTIGKPLIEITGTETYANLVTTIKASNINKTVNFNNNGFVAYVNFGGDGTILFDEKVITLIGGYFFGINFVFTDSIFNFISAYNSVHTYSNYTRTTVVAYKTAAVYHSKVADKLTFLNSGAVRTGGSGASSNLIFTNSVMRERYFNLATWGESQNVDFYNSQLHLEQCTNYLGRNFRFFNNGLQAQDIRLQIKSTTSSDIHQAFYDVVTDRTPKYLVISNFYVDSRSRPSIIYYYHDFYFSTNINLVDKNHNNITKFNITLTDKNGTTYTNQTAVLGYYEKFVNDTVTYATVYDLNPFNMTITADGYESYELNNFNITEKLDWTISLESRDWDYTQTLAWKILNKTDTTILKLTNDGNLAIAGELYENTNTAPPNVIYKIANVLWLTKSGDLYLVKELMEVII